MSQNDELATKQVDIKDTKISKLETVLNQTRFGFYTILMGTMASFGYGIVNNDAIAIEIGDKLLLPVIGWLGMYVATVVNKE